MILNCQVLTEESGKPNYLILQPISKYFKIIANTKLISWWKSKGLSDESIKPLTSSDNTFTREIEYYGTKARVKFGGSCLKQSKI